MNINIGELNKRIKIINYTVSVDEDGNLTRNENDYHECWAKVSNTSGTEIIKSGGDFSEVNTRFLIRYTQKEINTSYKILFNGYYYDIKYINDYNFSHEFIEIFATVKLPIIYVFDKQAILSWTERVGSVLAPVDLKVLVSEESATRNEFLTSYISGKRQSYIYKLTYQDWLSTKRIDATTNKPLYATSITVDNVKLSIIRTFIEKDSQVIELLCE